MDHSAPLPRDDQLRLALEAGRVGTWYWDRRSGEISWDSALERLFGVGPGEFDGTFDRWVGLIHPDDRTATLREVSEAVEQKGAYIVEHRISLPDGGVRWIQGRGRSVLDDTGEVVGTTGCAWDVTEAAELTRAHEQLIGDLERATEQQLADRERLEFLARVTEVLATADRREQIMREAVFAAVPRLGDWSVVAVLDDHRDSSTPIFEVAHADPEMVSYATELQRRFPYDPDAPSGIANVLRTGETEFIAEIDDATLAETVTTDEARSIVRQLALRSSIIVPLTKGGRVLGAMQLVNTSHRRVFTAQDVTLAEAVASRVASALENQRLTEALHVEEIRAAESRTRIALDVLHSAALPTDLPTVAGLDFGLRYQPAGSAMPVGGDWFDVFEVPGSDAVAIVVADVAGHGIEAAGVMVQIRNALRAYAMDGHGPAEVLRRSNALLCATHGARPFVTCCYVLIEPERRARWSCAGHFAPSLLRASVASSLTASDGLPLGVDPSAEYADDEATLAPGDRIFLYTDGLIERRDEVIDEGIERLHRVLADSPGLAVQAHVDRLVADLVEPDHDDDIAVVGVEIID